MGISNSMLLAQNHEVVVFDIDTVKVEILNNLTFESKGLKRTVGEKFLAVNLSKIAIEKCFEDGLNEVDFIGINSP